MEGLDLLVRNNLDRLRAEGLIRSWRIRNDHDSKTLDVVLYDNREPHYRITDSEVAMGGYDAVAEWLRVVERDVRSHARQTAGSQAMTATEMQNRQGQAAAWQQCMTQAQMDQALMQLRPQWLGDWNIEPPDPKAEQCSKDLFLAVAGKEAFDTLNSGKPLPITGSKGTKYLLHKKASYCIERVSDHASLCAVVPNVPLWDHLLGIKLMVENDEPKFLKTANVAGSIGALGIDIGALGLASLDWRA